MKRITVLALLVLFCTACESIINPKIWDISPVNYTVQVRDKDGNDLLDPENGNAIDPQSIIATFRGETYSISEQKTGTKAYMPHFYGLRIKTFPEYPESAYKGYCLTFGELDGAESYGNEELKIQWGDGTEDTISFTRNFKWAFDGSPKIKQKWFLNGKECNAVVEIVKTY